MFRANLYIEVSAMAIAVKQTNVNSIDLSLYETDFYAWTQEQLELLTSGQLEKVDLQNLAKEIANMAKDVN